jgi:hypothetical protein
MKPPLARVSKFISDRCFGFGKGRRGRRPQVAEEPQQADRQQVGDLAAAVFRQQGGGGVGIGHWVGLRERRRRGVRPGLTYAGDVKVARIWFREQRSPGDRSA